MTTIIPYPQKNSTITFREPCFRKEWTANKVKYYIKASIDGLPEREIRIVAQQQKNTMDYLLQVDKKLINAVVKCDSYSKFTVLQHSPQKDFFDMVKEKL